MTIVFWVVAGLVALLYFGAGAMKIVRSRAALQAAGMGWTETVLPPVIKLIGLAEVVGAVGLVAPVAIGVAEVLSPIAGACLTILMVGAVIVHRRRREPAGFQVVLTAVTLGATILAEITMG